MSSESGDRSFVSELAQQGGITFVGKICGRIFSFGFIILVTQAVAPNVYGKFTLALSAVVIIQSIMSFNLSQAVDYFLPRALEKNDTKLAQQIVVFVIQIVVLGSSIGTLVIMLGRGWIAQFFDANGLIPYLLVLSLVLPFQAVVNVQETVFSSFKRMEFRVIASEAGIPFLKLIMIVPFLYLGYEFIGLTVGYLAAIITAALVGFYLMLNYIDALNDSIQGLLRSPTLPIADMLDYAFPLYLTGIVYAVSGQISYLVLGFYLGPTEVGLYRVAYQLTTNLTLVNLAIAPVFKPMISESNSQDTIQERYRLAARWVLLLTIPMALVLAIAPKTYLRILFSSDYLAASAAVVPLSIGYLFNAITGPESMLIEGIGHTRITLFNSIAMVGSNTVLLFILVPMFGVFGAGLATGFALLLIPVLATVEIYIIESIHPFTTDGLKFLLAGIISAVVGFGFAQTIANQYIVAALLPLLILIVYIAAIRVLKGFSISEQRIAKQVDERLGYRILQRLI